MISTIQFNSKVINLKIPILKVTIDTVKMKYEMKMK